MNNKVYYEWRAIVGEDQDLHSHEELSDLLSPWLLDEIECGNAQVELCCKINSEHGDVCYAAVEDGVLPEHLTDAVGSNVRKVPKTYKKEFAASVLAGNIQ
jgi:hypothetical protein